MMWRRLFSETALSAIGGPLGDLARAAADRMAEGLRWLGGREVTHDAAFTLGVIVLSAKMAKADGLVTAPEINAFREVFRVPDEALEQVGRLFDRARVDAVGYEPYARQIAELFRQQPSILQQLLVGLFHIAKADGRVTDEELDFLAAVARAFGFSDEEFERIRAAEVTEAGLDPFAVLGLPGGADSIAVRQAYLALVRRHHPDVLAGEGLPIEFVQQAGARLAVVNAAYAQIVRSRGG